MNNERWKEFIFPDLLALQSEFPNIEMEKLRHKMQEMARVQCDKCAVMVAIPFSMLQITSRYDLESCNYFLDMKSEKFVLQCFTNHHDFLVQ